MLLPGTGLTVINGTPMIDPQGEAYFGPFPHNFGSVHWDKGAVAGSYFPPDTFVRVDDPQCGLVTSLQSLNRTSAGVDRCTLDALARPLPAGTTGVPRPDYSSRRASGLDRASPSHAWRTRQSRCDHDGGSRTLVVRYGNEQDLPDRLKQVCAAPCGRPKHPEPSHAQRSGRVLGMHQRCFWR